jgi:gliding motility-associated-like protein
MCFFEHHLMKNKKIPLLLIAVLSTLYSFAQRPVAQFSYSGRCQGQVFSFNNQANTSVGTIIRSKWIFDQNNPGDTSSQTNPDHVFLTDGIFPVTLIVFNSLGLSDTTTRIVTVYATPEAIIESNVPCFPRAIQFSDASTLSSGFINGIRWEFDNSTALFSPFLYSPDTTGTYSVTLIVTSDNFCRDTVTETIQYTDTPNISFTPPSPIQICEGDTAFILVTGANSYVWNTGDTTANIEATTEGWYKVIASSGNACFAEDSTFVDVVAPPIADAGEDVLIKRGESTVLRASGGSAYEWSPPTNLSDTFSATTTASPIVTTNYVVRVINSNGCSSTDTVTVTVDQDLSIEVPNLITPNNDGFNDVWNLQSISGIENASISIFNRWGWEVYKSSDYQHNWDGTMNGEPLTDGTYVYVIDFNDGRDPLRGTLEIFRNTQR